MPPNKTLAARGLEEHVQVSLIFARIVSFMSFLLITRNLLTDSSRIICPESFFLFDHEPVPLYHTHVLCTQGRRNISLIGQTVVGSLSVFEWADT